MLIHRDLSILLLVDLQARLVPAITEPETLIANCKKLADAANLVGVPVIASEQYPAGLGHTVDVVLASIDAGNIFAKMEFSCLQNEMLRKTVENTGRKQVVLAGIESHVCVLQSAIDLKCEGHDVFVVADAVSSRKPSSKDTAIERMSAAGISIVTTEMVLFEWLGSAEHPAFKALSKLIR